MSDPERAALHAAWARRLGAPDLVLPVPVEHGAPVDVLFFQTPESDRPREEDFLTIFATAGLTPGQELLLYLSRRRPLSGETLALGRALVALAAPRELAAGQVLREIRLPLLERFSAAMVTDYGVTSPDYLERAPQPTRLLCLVPLHAEEAPVVEHIGVLEANRRFLDEQLDLHDPTRPAAALAPLAPPPPAPPDDGEDDEDPATAVAEVGRIWDELEAWYALHSARAAAALLPGVEEAALEAAERELGRPLPAAYRASLRRHDGEVGFHSYEYLPLARSLRLRRRLEERRAEGAFAAQEVDGQGLLRDTWWSAGWVPFAEDGCGNLICIDLDPGPRGRSGQVFHWERSTGPEPAGARSFLRWLRRYRDDLLGGAVYEVDEEGFIVRR